ncbi:MAG: polyprenyl synthetase family protein [Flavobacteriales bacterium]|jgi:geranylgeranyl diphosphate synthase type II|nr:MAG: polyprenyl synthetase family protein [Flavobacteriales bacterium]|tara:strand:+ start:679 stop:1653 length:975 start_codon:yes stop_codon:yes gene_type:complete
MNKFNDYIKDLNDYIDKYLLSNYPSNLYDPVKYVLQNGGKRVRPLFTLFISDLFSEKINNALPAAASLEIFHNFTLVHDDIMDNALIRRGAKTINDKWNNNTAILSGDIMLILSYNLLSKYKDQTYIELSKELNNTAILVFEGQQYDIDFSTQNNVQIDDYFKMIELKTAELIACSFKFGGIVSEASENNIQTLYKIGKNLGIAFQLEDDYLDAFGQSKDFGKKIGGDILEKKKTLLYILSKENLEGDEEELFLNTFNFSDIDGEEKIKKIKSFYISSGSKKALEDYIKKYYDISINLIDDLELEENKKNVFKEYCSSLINRGS